MTDIAAIRARVTQDHSDGVTSDYSAREMKLVLDALDACKLETERRVGLLQQIIKDNDVLLGATHGLLDAAEAREAELREALLRYLATDGRNGLWDAMRFWDAQEAMLALIPIAEVKAEQDRIYAALGQSHE